MVKDRDTKMKETLKIMGLKPWIYAIGFLVQRGIWMIFPNFFICLFIYIFNSAQYNAGHVIVLFIALWLFGCGMLAVTMVVQNFFKESKLIAMLVPILQFIPMGVAMTLLINPIITEDTTDNLIQYLFWFPTFPFTVIMTNLL